jgi:hypothetical protein
LKNLRAAAKDFVESVGKYCVVAVLCGVRSQKVVAVKGQREGMGFLNVAKVRCVV